MNEHHSLNVAPKDGTVILAWHVIRKCWLPIKWAKVSCSGYDWIEATTAHYWPEDAFSQWMNQPDR